MIITNLKLANWRNFAQADVPLRDRAFIIGPNASGKSNLLDAVRFLRDVAKREGGGLQAAASKRGGVSAVRCLSARADATVSIETDLGKDADSRAEWTYRLEFSADETDGDKRALIREETVKRGDETILSRPDADDESDPERLAATALEQLGVNREFREIADFFGSVSYFHLVPQLVRYGAEIGGNRLENDPFGQGFMDRIAAADEDARASRLRKIEGALSAIIPHFDALDFKRDPRTGKPHLKARFAGWRKPDAWVDETELSDGALRLIGLFWALLDNDGLLLLEEPEISVDRDVKVRLPALVYRLSSPLHRGGGQRQVMLTTHSQYLLCDIGIDGREVLYITTDKRGSKIKSMNDDERMRKLLEAYLMPGEIAPLRPMGRYLPSYLNMGR